jgi:hypothetical protein
MGRKRAWQKRIEMTTPYGQNLPQALMRASEPGAVAFKSVDRICQQALIVAA